MVEGLHVPLTPFNDVGGKDGTDAPLQMVNDVPKLKVGVVLGITVTLIDTCNAHCPFDGVKV